MTTYLFAYRRPKDATPGTPEAAAAWLAWHKEVGDVMVDHGNPTFESTTVGACGPDTVLTGYSVVQADDLASAAALAKTSPSIERGGGVEVGEITVIDFDA